MGDGEVYVFEVTLDDLREGVQAELDRVGRTYAELEGLATTQDWTQAERRCWFLVKGLRDILHPLEP